MAHANWVGATVFRLSLLGTCQGQAIVNVFHFQATTAKESTLTSDTLAQTAGLDLATDFRTNMLATYLPMLPTDYLLNAVRGQVVERPAQKDHILLATDVTSGLPAAGSGTQVADDLTSAACIRWRGVTAGRHSRGRSYIGPLYDTRVTGGSLVSTTDYAAFATALLARYSGAGAGVTAGYSFVIYSRPYDAPNGAYTVRVPGSGLTVVNNTTDYDGGTTLVTTSSVDTVVRSQRRREIGIGA